MDGMTPALIALGVQHRTGIHLPRATCARVMRTRARTQGRPCRFCTTRPVTRLFLILSPDQHARLRGFAVCEPCAAELKADVAE